MMWIEIRTKSFERGRQRGNKGRFEPLGRVVCLLNIEAPRELAEEVAQRLSRESLDPLEEAWTARVKR